MRNIFIIYIAIAFSFLLPGSIKAEDLILKTFLTEEYDEPVSFSVEMSSSNLVLSTDDNNIAWERTEDFVTWHAVSTSKKYLAPIRKAKNTVFYRLSRCGPRTSKIYIPNDYDPKKTYPLILSLHGYTGNAKMQDRFFPLKDWAEKYDFIFCTPDGRKDSFGNQGWASGDSDYLRGLIDAAIEHYSIDTKRIYSSGHSNGAIYSYKMALDHSDIITAVVAISGIGFNNWKVETDNPVSVLHIHGTFDNIVWWSGDRFRNVYPSVLEYIDLWKDNNDCNERKSISNIDMRSQIPGKETEITRYENQNGSVVTELWKVKFAGHFPSPNRNSMERIVKWLLDRKRE